MRRVNDVRPRAFGTGRAERAYARLALFQRWKRFLGRATNSVHSLCVALTYTIAGAQAQLDALDTAMRARAWSDAFDALGSYRLIRAGLADSASHDGAALTLPDPDKLADQIDKQRDRINSQIDRGRRLAKARARHG